MVGEAVVLSVGAPQPNAPGGARVGDAVFASVWTPQLIPPGGLMVPEAALPLYRLHDHTFHPTQVQFTLSGRMSASWVLWRFRLRLVYGCGSLQASLGRLFTSKGCKGVMEYMKTTHI